MSYKLLPILMSLVLLPFSASCSGGEQLTGHSNRIQKAPEGTLFIVGGGSRPDAVITRLIREAELEQGGYGVILPMSGSNQDTSIYYADLQFRQQGLENVHGLKFETAVDPTEAQLDSIRNAAMIYLSGGDQRRFMNTVDGTRIDEAIRGAFKKGAVVAGTSAGAALMSEKMLTGDERRHPEYHSTYQHLEKDNMITRPGVGLIGGVIIDQHFVYRSRYNRLLTAVMELPDIQGIGIDESTAIIVNGASAEVVGESQVVVITNPDRSTVVRDGKLGARNLRMDIYLPGDTFELPEAPLGQ